MNDDANDKAGKKDKPKPRSADGERGAKKGSAE
jgi:hypothetical protein